MSLTKNDLEAIGNLIDKKLEPIKTEQQSQAKTLKYVKTKLNSTHGLVKYMSGDYDERIVNIDKRTDRIEDHLGLPSYKAKQ